MARDGIGADSGRGLVPPSPSPVKKPRGFKRGSPSGKRGKQFTVNGGLNGYFSPRGYPLKLNGDFSPRGSRHG